MRKMLRFGGAETLADGRRLRKPHFVKESNFPLTTACIVANNVRERFAAKLGCVASVDLFEPVAVTIGFMDRLLPGATVFAISAPAGRFWLLLSAQSVVALISAAFGEPGMRQPGALSALETQTLHAMARELAMLCAPIYGDIASLELTHDYAPMYEAASYFEVRIALNVPIYIGIVLACDPNDSFGACIAPLQLENVALSVRGIAGSCNITLAGLGALEIGDVLPMIRRESAQLITGKAVLAQGTCGVANGRNAFLIGTSGESTIS